MHGCVWPTHKESVLQRGQYSQETCHAIYGPFHVACNCPLWIVILTNERSEIVHHLTVLACEQAT